MSIFNEFLPKILDISKKSFKNFDDELKAAFECLEKFEEEYHSVRNGGRDKIQKDKLMTTLQSIDEDEDESTIETKSITSTSEPKRRLSKKRSKDEVDGISSPELDKRQKRNASVKAQSIISKQIKQRQMLKDLENNGLVILSPRESVNVNLTQKLRREEPTEKSRRRVKEDGKESALPVPDISIKQEKISLPPEPEAMDTACLPLNVDVKQELGKDDLAMPPPVAPVPKPRKAVQKEKEDSEEEGSKRRTRTKKTTDVGDMPAPPVPSTRSTRASSRASSRATKLIEEMPPPEPRPKRTRTKKKVSDTPSVESEKENSQPLANIIGENPRPKRTRRGRKASDKEQEKQEETTELKQKETTELKQKETENIQEITKTEDKTDITTKLKEERISEPEVKSPLLKTSKTKKEQYKTKAKNKVEKQNDIVEIEKSNALDETRVLDKVDCRVNDDMDRTIVLTNGVYNHAPDTPKNNAHGNETVVLDKFNRETMVLEKPNHVIMNSTVIIEKDPKTTKLTDDNSLLTDDSSDHESHTPPSKPMTKQPSSAVKEKVQQFEELAARTTRTKTRAMAKMDDPQDNHTPPDKMIKPILSAETLTKMDSLIFNGKKTTQISSSASKPRTLPPKPVLPSSTSKLSALSRHRDTADDKLKKEREDARKKKEALLEAKREMHKKKREEKMLAAAAVRSAAERERRLALEAAERERRGKQAHADQGRQDKLREAEKKKLELARKVAETEERRRAEEAARQLRLAEEQRRADLARRKQAEEAEAMKKEAALMAKEIEKRQKEYMEKQKLKQRLESEKLYSSLKPQIEPVYMADGFQYLNSDEDEEPPPAPVPAWSTSKMRKLALQIQSSVASTVIDGLFGVRVHSPDLRQIFPGIERARLKRTSSAVWRTPPKPGPH